MTREALEHQANQAIAAAKEELEQTGEFGTMFLAHADGQWTPINLPPDLSGLMNHGEAKDAIFWAWRKTVEAIRADATVFVSDTWMGKTTPEGNKHVGTPEWEALQEHGMAKLVQRGWIVRCEALMVAAQTPVEVLSIMQAYQRLESGRIQLLHAERHWIPQANFTGRAKMFSDPVPIEEFVRKKRTS